MARRPRFRYRLWELLGRGMLRYCFPYTLVPPLSVGEHTIRIQGTNRSFSVDVTYNLTVAPRA